MEEIKKFMYQCPTCHTGVQFDVPDFLSVNQMIELSNAISKLTCPRCGISLGQEASAGFATIKAYNKAVYDLVHIHTNVIPSLSPVEQDSE